MKKVICVAGAVVVGGIVVKKVVDNQINKELEFNEITEMINSNNKALEEILKMGEFTKKEFEEAIKNSEEILKKQKEYLNSQRNKYKDELINLFKNRK